MADIAKLRELLAKATPGPWECCDGPVGYQHRLYGEHSHNVCEVTTTNDAALITAMRKDIEALLDIAEAVAREGWKLVPIEATPAMLQAWWDSGCSDSRKMPNDVMGAAQQDWAAMLAAAPQPARPTPEGAE